MYRTGSGTDVHAFAEGRPLVLGGVTIPADKGLAGHSDADVVVHAVCDALLGAAALGDIGRWFPDTDEQYSGISSAILLEKVVAEIRKRGFGVVNVDVTILAQAPKLSPYIDAMRDTLSPLLHVEKDAVSIKATTTEGLGFVGRGEGIEARAVCLIKR